MFELADDYKDRGMAAYADFQEKEFGLSKEKGFTAVKHQSFVGAGYFDEIQMVISGGASSTVALKGSTEEEQFAGKKMEEKTPAPSPN
jgi:isocitrate lyase